MSESYMAYRKWRGKQSAWLISDEIHATAETVWKAAYQAGLEDAVKVCEDMPNIPTFRDGGDATCSESARACGLYG